MKKIAIFINQGGLGDVVMALNCLKPFKLRYPNTYITFSCSFDLLPLAYHNPYIDNLIPFFKDKFFKEVESYDKVIDLSDKVCLKYEFAKEPKVKKSRHRLFCEALGARYFRLKPKFYLSKDEIEASDHLIDLYGLTDSFRIGIISRAGSYSRIYKRFEELEPLLPLGAEIAVFKGKTIDWSDMEWDDTLIIENKPIREVASLMSKFHVIIGGDTGLMHLAASLNIPTIWLFSHIDGKMRTKEYKEAKFIQGKCKYSPCWYNIPCKNLGYDEWIPCLQEIEPEQIMKLVKPVYDKWINKEIKKFIIKEGN